MPLISQEILSILDGVSQQPDKMRAAGQAQAQVNMYDSIAHGKLKRPPTTYVAKLDNSAWSPASTYIWPVNRDSAERYHVVITGGAIKVFDAVTGQQYPVITPQGTGYLTLNSPPSYVLYGGSTPVSNTLPPVQNGFRFTTVQDTTFIVNQTVEVVPETTLTTPVRPKEALVSIAAADYGTNYTIVLNGVSFGFATTIPSAPASRAQLTTDGITAQFLTQLNAYTPFTGVFSFQQFGSTIYITRVDGTDFTVTASDGLADTAIHVIKGSVQAQSDLPARALAGFVIEVQPDPNNKYDATFYIYDDLGNPTEKGIWRECAAPGVLTNLDNDTMPWALTKLGNVVANAPADGGPAIQPIIGPWAPLSVNTTITADAGSGSHLIGDQGSTLLFTNALIGSSPRQTVATFAFDVDASLLPVAEFITVTVFNGAGQSASFVYAGGVVAPNQTLSVTNTALISGNVAKFELTYSRGSTPPPNHQASVTLHATAGIPPGLVLSVPGATAVTFNANQTYPAGPGSANAYYALQAGAVYHTVPVVDYTAATLATAFAAIAYTGYTVTNPVPGTVVFAASTPPAVTYSTGWDTRWDYHNGSLNLAPHSLIGYEIQNLTDGSSAVITDNNATSIYAAAGLAGGAQNRFLAGHQVAVTGPTGTMFFVFQPNNWTPRGVGDDNTNPFPSLTYQSIGEIGYTSGRLLLTAGENIVMSGANDVYNLFRTTVVSLLDSDRIDITANAQTVSDWHSIVHWAEGVWLWSANLQAQLPTEPALSNSTVSIVPQTTYASSPALRPLAMDRRVYFARERTGTVPTTQIFRYQRIRFPFFGFIAEEQTKQIPTYLQGYPIQIVGDPALEIMCVLTSAVPYQLYVYVFHYDDQQVLQQESWSLWQLDPGATILSMDMLDGHLGLIVGRSDGTYLETIDMQVALYDSV